MGDAILLDHPELVDLQCNVGDILPQSPMSSSCVHIQRCLLNCLHSRNLLDKGEENMTTALEFETLLENWIFLNVLSVWSAVSPVLSIYDET
ncbi:hypothetical protein TNCV_302261 [Trichonephila clavipes]|nr:hypothetical protein TNCV_302261 [Trichonephila clavipes]